MRSNSSAWVLLSKSGISTPSDGASRRRADKAGQPGVSSRFHFIRSRPPMLINNFYRKDSEISRFAARAIAVDIPLKVYLFLEGGRARPSAQPPPGARRFSQP